MAGLCLADSDRCFFSLSSNGKYSLIKRSRDRYLALPLHFYRISSIFTWIFLSGLPVRPAGEGQQTLWWSEAPGVHADHSKALYTRDISIDGADAQSLPGMSRITHQPHSPTPDNPLRKMSPNTEKNIAAIQYYVNIFRSICHSDLETHVFWHSYLWKQYC